MKVLVTGGVRSGKSTHAEALLAGDAAVTYVAPGPAADESADAEWAARVAAHRARRPETWRTVETRDLAAEIRRADGAVLVDCLGTWLTGVVDDAAAWELPDEDARGVVLGPLGSLVDAMEEATGTVVLVTNEVGLGVVPEHRSGRLFRDVLGVVNQRVAAACDEVHLVVAGRVLRI
jgi:adenosylcobinamide kinase/adenosylcobinamide-phosphate guanylyltransferase